MTLATRATALVAAGLLTACASPDPTPAPDPSTTAPTGPASTTPTSEDTTPSPTTSSPTPSPSDPRTPAPTASPSAPGRAGAASTQDDDLPPFASTVDEVVGHPAQDRMVGVSWREGCPVPLEQLRYLQLRHVGLDGAAHTGELVVHADVVDDVVAAFGRLYELRFPIERMRLVDDYGADDDASMRANNTSAFNCRTVAGTDRWSNHAHGLAVDINPLRNPYVRGDRIDPPEGAAYADRSNRRPGMLHAGSPEVAAWTDRGWDWGGSWSSGQDYQHVSANGG